jgi:chemotaxis protein MotB
MAKELAPIIIRKKIVHGGHHGGAWKVAYADFVTAMMALFIVLWLTASSEQVKKAVASYFIDPQSSTHETGSGRVGSGQSMAFSKQDLDQLKAKLQEAIKKRMPDFQKIKNQVNISVTGEGLRVELLEDQKGVFFESGNADPTSAAKELFKVLAAELGALPNHLLIEGHTDSKPFHSEAKGYSNWELSADRANSARRFLQQNGVKPDQIKEVRGFADQQLRNKADPNDAANRRVSILVQYQDPLLIPENVTRATMGVQSKVEAENEESHRVRAAAVEAAKAKESGKSGKPASTPPTHATAEPAKPSPAKK